MVKVYTATSMSIDGYIAGLLDEIWVDGDAVTHLRYRVRKEGP